MNGALYFMDPTVNRYHQSFNRPLGKWTCPLTLHSSGARKEKTAAKWHSFQDGFVNVRFSATKQAQHRDHYAPRTLFHTAYLKGVNYIPMKNEFNKFLGVSPCSKVAVENFRFRPGMVDSLWRSAAQTWHPAPKLPRDSTKRWASETASTLSAVTAWRRELRGVFYKMFGLKWNCWNMTKP